MKNDRQELQIWTLTHNEEKWIGLRFRFNQDYINKIKTIKGRRYSATDKCWYIPFNASSWAQFKFLQIPYLPTEHFSLETELEFAAGAKKEKVIAPSDSTGTTGHTKPLSDQTGIVPNILGTTSAPSDIIGERTADIRPGKVGRTKIIWNNQHFQVTIAFNKADSQFLKSLAGTYWNEKFHRWVVRAIPKNLALLQRHFGYWDPDSYD